MYPKIRRADGWVIYLPKFRYVSYWGTWHRTLGVYTDKDGQQYSVELEMTPINPSWTKSWTDMGERIILCQPTYDMSGGKDRYAPSLPPEVYTGIICELGTNRAAELLAFDYYSHIDFDKYAKVVNGGAQFKDCMKTIEAGVEKLCDLHGLNHPCPGCIQ